MLNSRKLLYIFSDVAYIAELLPAKKEGEFTVQNFRQVNGEFLNNDEFIAENIEKLFSKIDPEEYTLVLPDLFFTNTIVEVKEKAKTKVDKHIADELLPSLGISEDTHQVDHFVLTQYGDKSNVQLSALEKSLLAPIYESAQKHDVTIEKIVSLSWTIKSLISLEPSLSLVQMGDKIYLVQHYIGVDQANSAEVSDVEKIAETIKTLKGAQPSLQTAYLLTNELVEEKLKDLLKATLPLQQLSNFKDEKSEMPSYVKQAIEAGAKTLSVSDFNVPTFKLEKVEGGVVASSTKEEEKPSEMKEEETSEEEAQSPEEAVPETDKKEDSVDEANAEVDADADDSTDSEVEVKDIEDASDAEPLPEPSTPPSITTVASVGEETAVGTITADSESKEEKADEESKTDIDPEVKADELSEDTSSELDSETEKNENNQAESKEDDIVINKGIETDSDDDALSKFAVDKGTDKKEADKETESGKDTDKDMSEKVTEEPKVIKNKTGVGSMLKMIFVAISVFFVTVGIGVGLGLGFLAISQRIEPDQVAEASPTPVVSETPEPTPTPTPAPEINMEELSILVVNATTTAGYAGDIESLLEDAGFTDVDAANARGDYEEGDYILMSEENIALEEALEEATELSLEYSGEIDVEDLQGSYDAVVVLAQ